MLISLVYGIVTKVVLQMGMVDVVAENLFIILAVLSTVIFILINSNLESSKKGATLGKMIMGIKVVDLRGRQLTSKQSIIRNLYKLLTFILLLTDKNGQFLHENKSNSMVILK
jgi:uncharacterized RDD family membrane protein YckC